MHFECSSKADLPITNNMSATNREEIDQNKVHFVYFESQTEQRNMKGDQSELRKLGVGKTSQTTELQ